MSIRLTVHGDEEHVRVVEHEAELAAAEIELAAIAHALAHLEHGDRLRAARRGQHAPVVAAREQREHVAQRQQRRVRQLPRRELVEPAQRPHYIE